MAKSKHVDSKKIEKAAVLAVMNLIQSCETIDYKFSENDKNVLVDGTLELYHSEVLTKANLFGTIDVQIKGSLHKLRPNSRGFVKYPIEIVDLQKYQDVFHGVLFFCVAVGTAPGYAVGREVYFAQLLPYDIKQKLADTKPGQKTVKIRFNPFPTEPREIVRLTSAFHVDQEKQRQSVVSGYGFLDRNHELPPGIKSFSFSTRLFPGEDISTLAAFRNGAYIYGENERGQSLVFGKLENVCMFAMGQEAAVRSGDFELTTLVFAGEHEKGHYLEFEGINFIVSDSEATFNYTVSGDFRHRYNTVRFAIEFIKTGQMFINGKAVLRVAMGDDNAEQLQRLETSLGVYGQIVETLDVLSISAAWDPADITDKEISDLGFMHRLLVKKEPLSDRELDSPLVHFDIQDARIYAFAHKLEDGSYEFLDIFSEQLFFVFGWPNERAENKTTGFDPVPPVVTIGIEGFKKIVNLVPSKLEEAFERFPVTVGNQSPLNERLLEMLRAYDEGCQQPDALLASAAIIARRLCEFDSSSESYFLNHAQVVKRKREFEDEEKKRLGDIAIESNHMYSRAAAYALLDNTDMATNCLNRCSEEDRKQITEYPIARFLT